MGLSASAPWFKFYGDMPHTLNYPAKTIYELVRAAALKYPNDVAYEFMGKNVTYSQFMARIDRVAKALLALGVGKGDRFTICMPNCPQALDTFYALNRIGAVSNMIHPLSAPSEIAFYLNFSHSKAVLTLDQFYGKLDQIRGDLKQPTKLVIAQIKDELPAPLNLLYPMTKAARKVPKLPAAGDFIRWNDFLRGGKSIDELPDHPIGYTEGASILYSGGTTGTTKGILLSSANFNATALQTIAASGLHDIHGKKMLSVMPIFHGFGLGIGIHTALVGGATCILVPQFNVKTYAKLLIKKKPNLVPGVPTLFEALLRTDLLEDADLSFLDGMFSGGDSLSVELKHKVDDFLKAHRAKIQIREGYGTTECVTASCLTPKDYARSGSIGVPFPDTYYKIVKPGTTEETDPNIEGEICISGPSVMMCYVDNPEETAQTLRRHADGRIWLHTGDLGAMDTDGFVYFRQRIKRMIITSGYNVYPSQLENIIDGHEKVLLSCVVGVKDKYKMQKVKAFVVLRPGFEPTEEVRQELFDHCRKHIAKYAMPYEIEFRTELPKTLVGKVAYRVLEEEANAQVEA
ncbi:MAG: acyl--CoA ligase [Oscillospiraceae bacterium]|nr:acyl--CoA ligase [Oscillospiraceae bacterium]MBQ2143853.1 acyl--CoA ligase [Oscillospiraceae bacterium]MBQ2328962.1 acyl--CoA ligase [Oscillospiraceae bacterium]MBQ4302421.1 acyl--CoA ligase [Oscillospiraceae bacterium]